MKPTTKAKKKVKSVKRKDKQMGGESVHINKRIFKAIAVSLILLVIVSVTYPWIKPENQDNTQTGEQQEQKTELSLIQTVSAEEIGSMFACSCCGNPITKRCCGMAKERMTYIEAQVEANLGEEQIIMNMVKKYGLTAMMESEREKFKAKLEKNAPVDRPKIVITPTQYDFGEVSVAKGIVSTIMKVENKGEKDLIINKIETSCGCTSASLIVDGAEGPRFSMPGHGKQPVGWSATISPGKEAQLKVYYDPKVHRDMRGPGKRTVDISSNDPVDISTQVRIEFNQVA